MDKMGKWLREHLERRRGGETEKCIQEKGYRTRRTSPVNPFSELFWGIYCHGAALGVMMVYRNANPLGWAVIVR